MNELLVRFLYFADTESSRNLFVWITGLGGLVIGAAMIAMFVMCCFIKLRRKRKKINLTKNISYTPTQVKDEIPFYAVQKEQHGFYNSEQNYGNINNSNEVYYSDPDCPTELSLPTLGAFNHDLATCQQNPAYGYTNKIEKIEGKETFHISTKSNPAYGINVKKCTTNKDS